MDKSELDFLQDCQKELAALKEKVAALESRLAAWQGQKPEEADEVDFTGIELGVPEVIPAEEPEVPLAEAPAEPEPTVPGPVEPEPKEPEPEKPAPQKPADTLKYAWRGDNPGIPVKNIRSGISLLDRALFIGTLFKEDFALYDATIAELNNMETLDQAVAYVQEHFPQWNLGSDAVYRFMMAIRKKLG